MSLWDYLVRAASAWFMGFFPLLEIYLAVPAAIALGLDYVSAVVWSVLGNFSVVPLVIFFYGQLMRVEPLRRWLERRNTARWQRAMDRYGAWFVLLMTPLLGVWAMAAMAQAAGMSRVRLLTSSLTSITVYAVAIAVGIALGVDVLTHK
ncbi:MAG: small multi-drug export protein [Deinococcota bacterium]|nr:small multi-drug export protein [Deinococcota bacterium]